MNPGRSYLRASSVSWPSYHEVNLKWVFCSLRCNVASPSDYHPCPCDHSPACSVIRPCCWLAPQQTCGVSFHFGWVIHPNRFCEVKDVFRKRVLKWSQVLPRPKAMPWFCLHLLQGICSPASNLHTRQAEGHGPHLVVCLLVAFTSCKTCFISPEWEFGGLSLILCWCLWWI